MGKVKIKKKDTRIDMTAMSDVTVLLLTFFMLTSTFLTKEPAQVTIPPSVSEKKVPEEKAIQILVSQEGNTYFSMSGGTIIDEATGEKEVLTSEQMREEVLRAALHYYGEAKGKKITPSPKAIDNFKNLPSFGGCKLAEINKWLESGDVKSLDSQIQKKGFKLPDDNADFQIWLKAMKKVAQDHHIGKDLIGGRVLSVKADRSTPYSYVEAVTANLQEAQISKFNFMTALKEKE